MKKALSIAFFLMAFQMISFAQLSQKCWDFEESCSNPADAFHSLCISNAQSASGTPDVASGGDVSAQSGTKFAHMYAKYCGLNANEFHTEGIILNYQFVAGTSYTITFYMRTVGTLAPSETKIILVNSMPNLGGIENAGICNRVLDVLPAIPANNYVLNTYTESEIMTNAWEKKTITFTPTGNFNQIWFRPKEVDILSESNSDLYLDNICIKETCDFGQFNVAVCQYPELPGTVYATINGLTPPALFQWQLLKALDCNNGAQASNYGPAVPINWLVPNSRFSLPLNSGCYILARTITSGECAGQTTAFLFNTKSAGLPACIDPCNNWTLQMSNVPCDELYFWANPDSDQFAWPAGTTFTFTLDGVVRQSGNNSEFDYIHTKIGWHTICVTVNQPNCPTIRKCKTFYADCELSGGGFAGDKLQDRADNEQNAGKNFRISNPSSGTIWFSEPVESGTAYLYSMQGALIKSYTLNGTDRLDVSEVAIGQYMLSIRRPGDSISKLVLITHSN
ncbi:MAG: T9SS type A sorting domain-containing protein [Saprospiraceae bacterium]|nr:T9SS type A sorting domain-containing protein [Saprospiraceae bacterium]